ncbi:probable LRR receptor-like serine/threonine-protein kinase At1g05700 isoform X2 [Musa acuminata AAA Group]|uniref:probable LRR receptor-like serine/threonine-protein kinase At1g05700 isoform X2 n=1 Tax=Musa acuminata AAA Group TaxID=214697 RepID=UPI0031DB8C5C
MDIYVWCLLKQNSADGIDELSCRETMRNFIVGVCLGWLAAAILVNGQPGFVSIDCGATRSYTDSETGILYRVDEGYIDTGRNVRIAQRFIEDPTKVRPWFTVRSFPEGTRNCYTFPGLKEGDRYLVRASFVHGNYDGQASGDSVAPPLLFDLYVGVNIWQTINITEVFALYGAEIITAAPSDSLSICLANIGLGAPFISSLELRHIDNHLAYQDANQSAALLFYSRFNLGSLTNDTVRYPEDKYDRTWDPCNSYIGCETWYFTSSTLGIKTTRGDAYEVPGVVMGTATVAADNFTLQYFLGYGLNSSVQTTFYIYLHFADFDYLSGNGSRIFQVRADEEPDSDNISPAYLLATHFHFVHRLAYPGLNGYFNLTRVASSTLPPILNAAEVYIPINLSVLATDAADVDAMMGIKKLYQMKIWQGDPCAPQQFIWSGVNCTYSSSGTPRVTSLTLSYHGLNGAIPNTFANLKALNYLDLSNNDLTGPIPPSFEELTSLTVLILSNNRLNGPIPASLCDGQSKGLLELRVDNNPDICLCHGTCQIGSKGRKLATFTIVLIAVVPALIILLLLSLLLFFLRRRESTTKL